MRQILDMPTTQENGNASTCGYFARKGRCGRGFRNLPHTSVRRFRKYREKRRTADQTPVLYSRDLWFCCKKIGLRSEVFDFPRTSGITALNRELLRQWRHPRQHPLSPWLARQALHRMKKGRHSLVESVALKAPVELLYCSEVWYTALASTSNTGKCNP